MAKDWGKKLLWAAIGVGALWLGVRYVLPVVLPFGLGLLLALAAEPVTAFLVRKGRLSRTVSAGLGVGGVLVSFSALLSILGAMAVRELGTLMDALPDLQQMTRDGVTMAHAQLLYAAGYVPEGLRPLLLGIAERFLSDGTAIMDAVTDRIPGILGTVLLSVPDGALMLGTGILAGFMISARLPELRKLLSRHIPAKWKETYFPAMAKIRGALWGWLKAQMLLCLVTYGIVTAGFLFMKIPYAPAWAVPVAIVDAVPMLGTGTVLVPCALLSALQGEGGKAISYLVIWGISAGVRTVLEPKLVGENLGIDPLLTLFAIYAGYRFWGFPGLILAPMITAAIVQIFSAEKM